MKEIYNNENKKIKEMCKTVLDSYMQTFMTEETPEEDRIKNYIFSGYSMNDNGDEFKATITFYVTPVNESNTTWNKTINYCFASFTNANGEYVLNQISRYPENYDEFLERFEEYKKNNSTTIESTQIQSEDLTNNLANQKIEKMSNIISVCCTIILFIMICFIITRAIKNRKQ